MKKIEVLMVGPALDMKGGIASVSTTLLQSNTSYGYDIKYIPSYVDGNTLNKLIAAVRGIFIMILLLIKYNSKIVHVHSASRGSFRRKLIYFLIARLFKKKVIYHIHGAEFILYFNEASILEKKLITKVLTNVDRVIALSNRWKEDLQSIAPDAFIDVVHNPVNMKIFKGEHKETNNINILFMGRLGERKGIYDLLDIIPNIIKKHKNVYFYLCGDGDIEKVKEILKNKGIEENVIVPGWINSEDKVNYFKKGSVYVLPSYNEGLPISILEAMAASLPVIATNIGGIPEAIEHNINGYLISPGDKVELQEYLLKLVSDKNLRQKYGRNNIEKCGEYFDVNIVIKKINLIYTSLLS